MNIVSKNGVLGVDFTVCRNAEFLGANPEMIRCRADEAAAAMCDAAMHVLLDAGFDCESDGVFSHWAGGRFCNADRGSIRIGGVHAQIRVRVERGEDKDDDVRWRLPERDEVIPAAVREAAAMLCARASEAADVALLDLIREEMTGE